MKLALIIGQGVVILGVISLLVWLSDNGWHPLRAVAKWSRAIKQERLELRVRRAWLSHLYAERRTRWINMGMTELWEEEQRLSREVARAGDGDPVVCGLLRCEWMFVRALEQSRLNPPTQMVMEAWGYDQETPTGIVIG